MKARSIISLAAAAAISLSFAGCSIEVGTQNKTFADNINSMNLADDAVVARPTGEGIENKDALEIDYLTFKKEYLYWMLSNGITDDTAEDVADKAAQQRYSIINYLINEQIINDKAKQLGVDVFTQEELDEIEKAYQENIDENIRFFADNMDFSTIENSGSLTDEDKLRLGAEEFDKYLANALLTRDDLLAWQRSSVLTEKVLTEVVKDVVIDRSEAVDTFNGYVESVKKIYEEDPVSYETGGQLSAFWIPEGTRNIKHILIGLEEKDSDEIAAIRQNGDEEGADALRAEKLAEIEQQAIEVKNMLDNGADFDELIAEYSADADGSKMYPDGYQVIPNSTMYVSDFVEAAFSIENIGEYVLAASDYGWHIVLYASDSEIPQEDKDDYIDYIHKSLIATAQDERQTEIMKQWRDEYSYETDYGSLKIDIADETTEAESGTGSTAA